ncbi:MAG: class II aldolase/adducin family protein [Burkholderiaceae bacterium]|nr:class II aldolase/adducin family protein [Burkholderiaceae bacterium]
MTAPAFATEQAARSALLETARALAPADLNAGRAGNLSVRWHRGGRDGLLLTPSATDYGAMSEDDIAWLPFAPDEPAADDDAPGCPAEWFGPRPPSSEWRIHHDLQRAQPGIGAVVHAHAPYASTLACLAQVQRDGVPAFHYMVAVAGGDSIPCAPYASFGSARLSALALEALRERRACLLANHGMVAVGASLAAAFELALEVEWLCRVYWQALQAGCPVLLDAGQIGEALARFALYRAGRH